MITITKNAENDFTTACEGVDGCGEKWEGLYSEMTAEDVARTHNHGPAVKMPEANEWPELYRWGVDRRLAAALRADRRAAQVEAGKRAGRSHERAMRSIKRAMRSIKR